MNFYEKIPVKTKAFDLTGENVEIDTKGLEATLVVNNGTAFVKARPEVNDSDAFVLEKGGSITLNGLFYLSGNAANVRVLYCRVI